MEPESSSVTSEHGAQTEISRAGNSRAVATSGDVVHRWGCAGGGRGGSYSVVGRSPLVAAAPPWLLERRARFGPLQWPPDDDCATCANTHRER